MKLDDWLKSATNTLKEAGIGSARLDCLVLLEDELEHEKSWLLAHSEHQISPESLARLNKKLTRRQKHEPIAYIRGFCEFYGRKFMINKRALEPRPESEAIIDLLKQLKLPKTTVMADIGTGTGALGILAALETHSTEVDLYDIDASVLAVAKHNVVLHELNLKTYKRDLLSRPVRKYEVIIANLPYVPDHWKINEAAAMEPRIAIFGGPDGLDLYRRMFKQVEKLSHKPRYVFTESLPPQHNQLKKIAATSGFAQINEQDFIQLFQLV